MWRWTRRILIGLCTGFIVAACSGATYQWISTRKELAETPPPGRLVDVGGHRLHIWCTGAGEPAVILETGLGGSTVGWGFVQPEVARFTRVCSYDRAGLGYSDPGPSPRTTRRSARELEQLLDRSGIAGPWVLVGASSGGFIARLFASERAERVAGLVLVDASHEDQAHDIPGSPHLCRFSHRSEPFDCSACHSARLRLVGAVSSWIRACDEVPGRRIPGGRGRNHPYPGECRRGQEHSTWLTIPLIVVTGARGADETWRHLQRDQVGLSRRGCQIIADQSGHVVALEQPGVVVEAIRAIVETARGRNDVPLCAAHRRRLTRCLAAVQRAKPLSRRPSGRRARCMIVRVTACSCRPRASAPTAPPCCRRDRGSRRTCRFRPTRVLSRARCRSLSAARACRPANRRDS